MKYTKIKGYHVGLVTKNGAFARLIYEGRHWLWWGEEVSVYDMTKLFVSDYDLNLLLKNQEMADALEIVDVKDNEKVLQYENGIFQTILGKGRWAYWKGGREFKYIRVDVNQIEISKEIDLASLMSTTVSSLVRTYVVEAFERGLLFVDGKFVRMLEAGTYYWWKNSTSIHVSKADTRQLQLEVSGQEILTKDKASLRINFYVQYQIVDFTKALLANKDFDKQLYILIQLALREYIGALTLDELLEKKDNISTLVIQSTLLKVSQLGIELKGAGIRDIILTGEMKEIMNQVLMAEKKAQANLIMRREETASVRSMLNTAKLMEENAMLWKLKEMEYVEKIADKINTISVAGNGQILDQLKQIFVSK